VGTRPETQIEIVTPVIIVEEERDHPAGIELGAPLHLNLVVLPERKDNRLRRLRQLPAAACAHFRKPACPTPSATGELFLPGAELGIWPE